MCYSSRCRYETYEGECNAPTKRIYSDTKYGNTIVVLYPEDAMCEIEAREYAEELTNNDSGRVEES